MASKIIVGLVVALLGTGLGVYVAFSGSALPPCGECPTQVLSVSEGGCCSQVKSCCEAEPLANCCAESTACPPAEVVAACAGGAVIGNAPAPKPIVSSRTSVQ